MLPTIVQDSFGRRYRIFTAFDRPSHITIEALSFYDNDKATRFLKSLNASQTLWSKLLQHYPASLPSRLSAEALLRTVATLLVNQKIRFYEIPPAQTENVISHSIQGETLTLMSGARALEQMPSGMQKITSLAAAEKAIQGLDSAQIKSLADSLNKAGGASNQSPEKTVAQALLDGRLTLLKSKQQGPIAKIPEYEEVANLPGAKPVSEPPKQSPAPAKEPVKRNFDQEQAETLIEAAATAAALCEDCNNDETPPPYKILG